MTAKHPTDTALVLAKSESPSALAKRTLPPVAQRRADAVGAYLAKLAAGVSRETMRACLGRFVAMFGADPARLEAFPWEDVRVKAVEAFAAKVQLPRVHVDADGRRITRPGLSYASVNKHLSAINGVMRKCHREHMISADDLLHIRTIERVRGKRLLRGRSVSAVELKALFTACDESTAYGARSRAVLTLLYACGLRRAEVASAQLAGYDVGAGTVTVIGKGNKERAVPLAKKNGAAVEQWIKFRGRAPGPLILAMTKARAIRGDRTGVSGSAILKLLSAVVDDANEKTCSPHDMRRSFISDLLDAGVDIATVQKMAGHADIQTTAMYDRRPARAQHAAAELLTVPK